MSVRGMNYALTGLSTNNGLEPRALPWAFEFQPFGLNTYELSDSLNLLTG